MLAVPHELALLNDTLLAAEGVAMDHWPHWQEVATKFWDATSIRWMILTNCWDNVTAGFWP